MCKISYFGNKIWNQRVRLMTIFTLSLHIFDIVTDILVAIDLNEQKSK